MEEKRMGGFSFGILVGSIIAACTFAPKAFERPAGFISAILFLGIIAAYSFADLEFTFLSGDNDYGIDGGNSSGAGFLAFMFAVALINGSCWLLGKGAVEAEAKRRTAVSNAARDREEQAAALERDISLAKTEWMKNLVGWKFQTFGKVLNLPDRPQCIICLSADDRLFRIVQFNDETEFAIISDEVLALTKISSADIAYPAVHRTVYDTQAVPILSKQKRSTVGRAVIGGALFGPVGAVVGAASSLNGPLITKVEERQVARKIEGKGDPQLIVVLADVHTPILKFQLDPPQLAEEWAYRIRAGQRR